MNHIKKFNEEIDWEPNVELLVNQFLDLNEKEQELFLRRIDDIQEEISRKNFTDLKNNPPEWANKGKNINESLQTDQISSMFIETNQWEDDEDFGIYKNLVIETKSGKTYRTKVKGKDDEYEDGPEA